MRLCSACGKADKPWFESAPCSCHLRDVRHDDDPRPDKHDPSCKAIGHEVVLYPVRIDKRDLTFDGKLPAYWTSRGWVLKQNGLRFYRAKMLCRDCIGLENDALARREEYLRACKAARGIDTQTYAQMLASQ